MSEPRTFVIGDIHGCADELDRLLDGLAPNNDDRVVFLGDYIDRGPSPKGVIDRLLRLRREGPRCIFLKGNHEDMFLGYLGRAGLYGDAFLFNGGAATLRSYGVADRAEPVSVDMLPPEHVDFFLSLQLQYREGEFLCVHGGLAPNRGLDEQSSEDMLWIRDEFISQPHPFACTVLFGHTPQREVLLDLPYKVGLDTGLVYWNKLSCLELRGKRLYQIRRGERAVGSRNLRAQFAHPHRHPPAPRRVARNHHREDLP